MEADASVPAEQVVSRRSKALPKQFRLFPGTHLAEGWSSCTAALANARQLLPRNNYQQKQQYHHANGDSDQHAAQRHENGSAE